MIGQSFLRAAGVAAGGVIYLVGAAFGHNLEELVFCLYQVIISNILAVTIMLIPSIIE